jgi:hypothetical protein
VAHDRRTTNKKMGPLQGGPCNAIELPELAPQATAAGNHVKQVQNGPVDRAC